MTLPIETDSKKLLQKALIPTSFVPKLSKGNYLQPRTKDLIDRSTSLLATFEKLIEDERLFITNRDQIEKKRAILEKLIQERWNIDEKFKEFAGQAKQEKLRRAFLRKVYYEYRQYISHEILPLLIRAIKKPAETNRNALMRFVDAENFYLSTRVIKIDDNPLFEGWPIIEADFELESANGTKTTYVSKQIPQGRLTKSQLKNIQSDPEQRKFLSLDESGEYKSELITNCYRRSGEGVSAFRMQTFSFNDQTAIQFYQHTSPIPYQEKNQLKRLGMTVRNAEQIIQNVADQFVAKEVAFWNFTDNSSAQDSIAGLYNSEEKAMVVPLTEIRLLSPIYRSLSIFDGQRQYQQVLESFIAFNICNNKPFEASVCFPDGKIRKMFIKPDISFVDYGVNRFRREEYSDPLQDQIITIGFNKLVNDVLKYLQRSNLDYGPHEQLLKSFYDNKTVKRIVEQVNAKREDLKCLYEELRGLIDMADGIPGPDLQNKYENKVAEILIKLEEQHQLESQLLKQHKAWWKLNREIWLAKIDKTKAKGLENILGDFAQVQDLYFNKQYNDPKNNYWLQKISARLNYQIDRAVAIGCNDAIDRAGMAATMIEADIVFHKEYGYYPHYQNKDDRKKLKTIQSYVFENSSNLQGTEAFRTPGARGFQVYRRDGLKRFNTENNYMARLGKEIYHLPLRLRLEDKLIAAKKWLAKAFVMRTESASLSAEQKLLVQNNNFGRSLLFNVFKGSPLKKIALKVIALIMAVLLSPFFNTSLAGVKEDRISSSKKEERSLGSAIESPAVIQALLRREGKPKEPQKPLPDNMLPISNRKKFTESYSDESSESISEFSDVEEENVAAAIEESVQVYENNENIVATPSSYFKKVTTSPVGALAPMSGSDLQDTQSSDVRLCH